MEKNSKYSTILIEDITKFFYIIKATARLTDYVKIEFYQDWLNYSGMDESKSCLFDLKIEKEYFKEFNFVGSNPEFIINIKSLIEILEKDKSRKSIKLIFNHDKKLVLLKLIGKTIKKYELPLLNDSIYLKKFDYNKLEFQNEITFEGKSFKDIINEIKLKIKDWFGVAIRIKCIKQENRMKFAFYSKMDRYDFIKDDLTEKILSLKITENSESNYCMSHVEFPFEISERFQTIIIKINTEELMLIQLLSKKLKINYLVTPKDPKGNCEFIYKLTKLKKEHIEYLIQSRNIPVLKRLVKRKDFPNELIEKLLQVNDRQITEEIISQEKLSNEIICNIIDTGDDWNSLMMIANRPDLPEEIIRKLIKLGDREISGNIARRDSLPEDLIERLMDVAPGELLGNKKIKLSPYILVGLVRMFSRDGFKEDDYYREDILNRPEINEEVLEAFLGTKISEKAQVPQHLVSAMKRLDVSIDLLIKFASSNNEYIGDYARDVLIHQDEIPLKSIVWMLNYRLYNNKGYDEIIKSYLNRLNEEKLIEVIKFILTFPRESRKFDHRDIFKDIIPPLTDSILQKLFFEKGVPNSLLISLEDEKNSQIRENLRKNYRI